MKNFAFTMILCCAISHALCLKCYEWSDETDHGEPVDCPKEANACLKAVGEMYQTKAYARSCGVLEDNAEDGDCVLMHDQDIFSGIGEAMVCYCTTDLCNHASLVSSGTSYLSAVIIFLVAHYIYGL